MFTDITDATLSTQYTSNQITVAGINDTADITITGGTYSKNGGAYTSDPGTVAAGDTVTVGVTSSGSFATAVDGILTIGGVSDTYTVTTLDEDTTPTAFTFTDVTGADLSTVYTSNTITVAGINSAADVTITGGTYSKNGGAYTANAGTVAADDEVTVRVTSSGSYSTAVNAVLTIGGVSDTYTVTTLGDTVPDAFVFTDITDATLSTQYTSNQITVAGIDTAAAISITGGTYSKNAGAYTSDPGTVVAGDTVTVRVTSSGSFATAVDGILSIGGVSDTYTVTTLNEDTAPTAFTFTDVTDADLSTVYTSNTITVAGINSTADITITGGTYSKNGGAYTADAGTVVADDTVTVRVTSSASYSTAVDAVLTIGGVSDTYTVTTLDDTVPDAFVFTDITDATLSTQYTSNQITVAGINAAADITITGGTYNKNSGAYTSDPGTVAAGDAVTVRVTSSDSSLTAVNVVLTIGGVSDTYTVTTLGDTTVSTNTDNHNKYYKYYKKYKKDFKSSANKAIYNRINKLRKTNNSEFLRLKSIYDRYHVAGNKVRNTLDLETQEDYKDYRAYNGYNKYLDYKDKANQ